LLFRYPGSKKKVARQIAGIVKSYYKGGDCSHSEFREPFFGAGAVGFEVLTSVDLERAWFNDRDPAICCVWEQVLRDPQGLEALLCDFVPGVDRFFEFKHDLQEMTSLEGVTDRAIVALKKIACHQLSYSGLGTMAGGPIGGRGQGGIYGVGCRYSLPRLIKDVDRTSELLDRVVLHPDVCSNLDFEQVLQFPGDAVFYLDPPYYEAGPGLYQFSFAEDDHARLAALLRDEDRPWLLSYDKHPAIEDLYGGWAELGEVTLSYSINGANSKTEYLIANAPLRDAVREVFAEQVQTRRGDAPSPRRSTRRRDFTIGDRSTIPGRIDRLVSGGEAGP
jgi:DNA adenine methylase